MTVPLPSRDMSIVLLGFGVLVLVSLSRFGGALESIIYTGYGLAIPFVFLLMALGGIYFGARHLLSS
ncbi:MAG: hypothetical protein ABEJ84_06290 [Halodesulfurarchaeum sp.]